MNKIITIDKLQVGMEVIALDKSWLETNILFHRFRVQSKDEIQRLRENGIRMVTIRIPDPTPSAVLSKENSTDPVEVQEEVPVFREMEVLSVPSLKEWNVLHDKTIAVITKSFESIRMGNPLEVSPLRSQVVETLEMLLRDTRKISFLVTLSEVDDESYVHSTNTMILAMGLAEQAGVSREELPNWGLAALLHDIGKALMPLDILKKPGKLDPNEWETMKRHPKIGYSILSKSKEDTVRGLCAKVAIEHHERKGGVGYPFGLELTDIDPVSRSLMVLDVYEALTAGRIYRPPLSPAKTLTYLLERELHRLDPRAIANLVQMVGIYPVGSCVQLTDGRIALITSYDDPDTHVGPVQLMAIFQKPGTPLPEPVPINLTAIDRSRVKQTYHPRELGLSPTDVDRFFEQAEALKKRS